MKSPIAVVAIVLAAGTVAAQDWNQWRGPARTGAAPSFKPPAAWPERPKQAWKVAAAGVGHSSPVVSGNRVFLFSRVGEQEAATAYDLATGKQIWRQAYGAPYTMNPAATNHGKGPKSTPLVHRNHLYTLGINGTLSAFNLADGRVLWRKDFAKDFKTTAPEFGTAMSPVADDGTVIAHVGGSRNGALMAFDAGTGAVKWSWKGDGPAYASPVIATFAGVRQVVTQSQTHLIGLSAADGTPLWQIPFTTDYEQNSVTPIVSGDLLIYAGLQKPTTAVRVVGHQGDWALSEVWKNADVPMYMNTAVESGGLLVGLTNKNRGQFFCVDAKTGKTLWTGPGRQGENAALVTAGSFILAVTTDSELIVIRRDPKALDVVRKYTIADSPVWAHPAPAGTGLVIKDAETLALWTF